MNGCVVPINIIKDEFGNPKYIRCEETPTHMVVGSDWVVCEAHANGMLLEGKWRLVRMEKTSHASSE